MNRSDGKASTEIVKTGYQWLHPPSSLIQGRVSYIVRMLGFTEVAKSAGANVLREAYLAIKYSIEQSSTPQKPVKVELSINVSEIQISDVKTKKLLHVHQLRKISYCADDKENRRIFAYIAKDDLQKLFCYVFLTDTAEKIASTIGEAFDLAFQEYFDKTTTKHMPSNEMAKLEERIQQLEAENGGLIAEINALKRKQMMLENMSPPPLPRTPIPKRPSALSLAIGNKSPFWNQPSEFSPPPLDRAPSLEDHKASEAAKIIDEIIADSFPDLNLDFSKTKKKPEIIDEIDGTFNQHDVIAVADDDEKGKSDLKLLISHVSSQNDDKITVADTVKFESKDNEAEKCSSLKSAMQKDDSDKHDQIKKEGDGDDDDYMIPRFKLANP